MAYAWALFRAGRLPTRGPDAARRALALDPLAPGLRHAFVALAIGTRRYDVALREVRTTGGGGAADPVSAILESYAQLLSGQATRCAERDPGPWVARARDVPAPARPRRRGRGDRGLPGPRAGRGALPFLHQYADLAAYYAWRGDAAQSVHWLERAVAHSPMLHRWQLESGLFDKVRRLARVSRPGLRGREQQAEERLRARRAAIGE